MLGVQGAGYPLKQVQKCSAGSGMLSTVLSLISGQVNVTPKRRHLLLSWTLVPAASLLCSSADFCVSVLPAAAGLWSRLKGSSRSRGKGKGTAFLSSNTGRKAHQSRAFLLPAVIPFSMTIHSVPLTNCQISRF